VEVALDAGDGFRIHPEALLERCTEHTKAVLLNSPSNPTGGTITPDGLRRLAAGCAERGILLIADETYERFVYAGEHASVATLAGELPDTVALVGSFSKTYAMTGWRLGYLFAPKPILGAVLDVQSHAVSNPTSFAMKGAVAALESAEPDVERMIAEYRRRRDFLIPHLNALAGMSCEPPAGAFYAFPDVSGCFRDDVVGSVAFAEYLLEEARVAVVPGAAFGDDDHIRISFACSQETLARGLERIAESLATLSPRV
jgi:aspartate aminotransferase